MVRWWVAFNNRPAVCFFLAKIRFDAVVIYFAITCDLRGVNGLRCNYRKCRGPWDVRWI